MSFRPIDPHSTANQLVPYFPVVFFCFLVSGTYWVLLLANQATEPPTRSEVKFRGEPGFLAFFYFKGFHCYNVLIAVHLVTLLDITNLVIYLNHSQYRFDPHTGAWENRYFSADEAKPPFSLHDVTYDVIGVVMKTTGRPREFDVKLEVSAIKLYTRMALLSVRVHSFSL